MWLSIGKKRDDVLLASELLLTLLTRQIYGALFRIAFFSAVTARTWAISRIHTSRRPARCIEQPGSTALVGKKAEMTMCQMNVRCQSGR